MLFCFEDVKAFQTKFDVPMPFNLSLLSDEAYNFRIGFLQEEQNEFIDSHEKKDFVGCIDALIDEVYVACGTSLMMGVDNISWLQAFDEIMFKENEISVLNLDKLPNISGPRFLTQEEYNKAISLLKLNLNNFIHYHYYGNLHHCTKSMTSLVSVCYSISNYMGINWMTWRELWDDVQRANMSKVRATDASQSKRKTSLDVVKPAGWIGPNGEAILNNRYPNWQSKLMKE